ncbi:MAG: c-type cytochrome, partial [Planctomycetia bacterium]|nr:c-type cytochrome [Planctomycetia bacterium]
ACYVQGEVTVTLAGKTVISGRAEQPKWLSSQPLELEFDYHPLEISFRRNQAKGQLALFWSGPDFRLEPLQERALVHERDKTPSIEFERGRQLAAALRCAACHMDTASAVVPAPALDRLSGNVHEHWLVDWLGSHAGAEDSKSVRRMPDLGMTRQEAEAISAWLLRESAKIEQKKEQKATKEETKKSESKSGKKSKAEEKPKPSAEEGERLILARGCLACHKFGEFGESGLFGGGDLTPLFDKRPVEFLNRWLQDPAAINKQHRMPVFTFTNDELTSLSLWAKERASVVGTLGVQSQGKTSDRQALMRDGEKLIGTLKCAACHTLSSDQTKPLVPSQKELTSASDWARSCAAEPLREKIQPGYRLAADDQAALRAYYSASRSGEGKRSPQARGRDLLVQLNCLACHQREGIDRSVVGTLRVPLSSNDGTRSVPTTHLPALQDKLVAVSEAHAELAPLVPAMTPPALNSVGDKLHDAALADAITRQGPPHRPYLLVQMPKFNLSSEQLAALIAYFVATDRIPSAAGFQPAVQDASGQKPAAQVLEAAGPRLITADGLSCTSCHQVGSVLPSKAPLNARGPDMSMLGKRIRREWFDRWCDDPARIVPRMEMPAVKVPVRGVLNDNIDDQLAAVWHILNTPGFQPPEPNPVRVLRLSGIPERKERPIFIRDVMKDGDKTYLFPLVVGLPNRHNILFDLENFRLAAWWLGDTARQRTKGKTWYWESGGKPLFDAGFTESDVSFTYSGHERRPERAPQFAARLDRYGFAALRDGTMLYEPMLNGWLTVSAVEQSGKETKPAAQVSFSIRVVPLPREAMQVGVQRSGLPDGATVELPARTLPPGTSGFAVSQWFSGRQKERIDEARLRLVSPQVAANSNWDQSTATLTLPGEKAFIRLPAVATGRMRWNGDGSVSVTPYPPDPAGMWHASFHCEYFTSLPVDVYLAEAPPVAPVAAATVTIAPGFTGLRLPLSDEIMPSGFSWTADGKLVFATLKGEVFSGLDTDGNGEEDKLQLIVDGLATPYGISAFAPVAIDVITKDGLLRLMIADGGDRATLVETVASGWGMTDDYHDWAVGLVRGENDFYYIALPCQQDQRSDAAASLRSSGHRFPMGLVRNRDGELFVTDNQGNYNPFNELNHVRKGAHFGFINALEKEKGYKPPPLTPPAVNIPHPWTRSVNGICFLDTPQELRDKGNQNIYGPLEGHLVGCEYDTRRLIRMSLQKVGDTYQGAAYPLSIPPADVEKGLLGPIVCAIKPTTGELYVGEIRDSGWGASNNIGQIVKIKIEPEKLTCGIAEVRATKTGFTIDFFKPVDRAKAVDVASYSIQSYRRESTPAYGGPDLDRRSETILAAEVSADGKRVTLRLPELRRGH